MAKKVIPSPLKHTFWENCLVCGESILVSKWKKELICMDCYKKRSRQNAKH